MGRAPEVQRGQGYMPDIPGNSPPFSPSRAHSFAPNRRACRVTHVSNNPRLAVRSPAAFDTPDANRESFQTHP
ncbi:MAG TPA: hypothetical protein VK997_03780 [Deferrisomatales bacterium]|nr:hypothetical protein [Deferrisomatales bacterium]